MVRQYPDLMDLYLGKLWERVEDKEPGVLQCMGSQRVGHNFVNNKNNNWSSAQDSALSAAVT